MRRTLLVAVLVLFGCYGAHSYGRTYPPTRVEDIEVVVLNQVPRPHEIIGRVQGDLLLHDAAYLKRLAATLGADAISIPFGTRAGYLVAYAIKYRAPESPPATPQSSRPSACVEWRSACIVRCSDGTTHPVAVTPCLDKEPGASACTYASAADYALACSGPGVTLQDCGDCSPWRQKP